MASRVVLDFRGPQPGAGLATKTIAAGDKALVIVSNTPVHSDLIVQPRDLASNNSDQLPGTIGINNLTNIAVPLVSRQGAMYMDPDDPLYGNRPLIEIINKSASASGASGTAANAVVKSYDQMILSAVQEQDSEKTDVHETFGAPHFFASGRFVRRFTFSGAVRGSPVNAQSQKDALKVTQHTLMRLFYDKYMRISVQALKGWFTRITVNKEIYEGFVSTLNFNTAAENEHFIPFIFSMFGTARRNDMLDPSGSKLLGINTGNVIGSQANARARAEVSDATKQSKLKALPSVTDLGTLNHNNPVPYGIARIPIQLSFEPRPELLSVKSDTPGIEPVYDPIVFGGRKRNVPLHGTVPPVPGPFPIDFRITDYWVLYNAVLDRLKKPTTLISAGTIQKPPPGETTLLPGVVNFSIITASKEAVKVAVRFHLTPPSNVVVGRVKGFVDNHQVGDGSIVPLNSDNTEIVLGEIAAKDAYDNSNALAVSLRFFLDTPDGSPVPPEALVGATVVYDIQTVYPALGKALIGVENPIDLTICNAIFAVNNTLTAVPEENSFHNEFVAQLVSNVLLANVNPFAEADRVVIRMRPTIVLKGFPLLKLPAFSIVVISGSPPSRTALKKLNFIGAEWKPIQTVVKITDENTSQRLDQFGFLRFSITTADSQDVAKSVYAAIKRGTLSIQTRFARSVAQSSARIDRIPLNGRSYGTGEFLDPESGQRIYIRTRLASLSFDTSLRAIVMKIEVNTSYRSGFAAYLYSARFWSYISEVVSATLEIPAATSIVPPVSWAK